jgi:hypothetical protein
MVCAPSSSTAGAPPTSKVRDEAIVNVSLRRSDSAISASFATASAASSSGSGSARL